MENTIRGKLENLYTYNNYKNVECGMIFTTIAGNLTNIFTQIPTDVKNSIAYVTMFTTLAFLGMISSGGFSKTNEIKSYHDTVDIANNDVAKFLSDKNCNVTTSQASVGTIVLSKPGEKYLLSHGLFANDIVLADVGWHGTTQYILKKIQQKETKA